MSIMLLIQYTFHIHHLRMWQLGGLNKDILQKSSQAFESHRSQEEFSVFRNQIESTNMQTGTFWQKKGQI